MFLIGCVNANGKNTAFRRSKPGFKKFIYPHGESLLGGLKFAAFVSKFLLF
jgi:hypothetical protein